MQGEEVIEELQKGQVKVIISNLLPVTREDHHKKKRKTEVYVRLVPVYTKSIH
jgi:hypothetical protein